MNILALSVSELSLFNELTKLAEEASHAVEVINANFSNAFGIGKKEIHVFSTESCGEYYGDGYLTIDGIFKYHDNWWGGRDWSVTCTPDGIYKMLRANLLCDTNRGNLIPPEERELGDVAHYFRMFINQTELNSK